MLLYIGIHVVFLIQNVQSHLRLTTPPARSYPLDFLDNFRTTGPCGMPRSESSMVTSFAEGANIKVTWHLAYAHKGGYEIDVWNVKTGERKMLTPSGFTSGLDDSSAQMHQVMLPAGFTCDECVLRIMRQASEWGGAYRFWSCSDISIVTSSMFTQTCSGHGQATLSGECRCEKLYSGNQCQNKDDCMDDEDCGGSEFGMCIHTNSTSYPIKQCYCEPGAFGRNCQKRSSLSSTDFDPLNYNKRQLSSRYDIYYRVLKEIGEVEVIMQVKGTSFVALGSRPQGMKQTCRMDMPKLDFSTDDLGPGPQGLPGPSLGSPLL
jgi:hypothetical protein